MAVPDPAVLRSLEARLAGMRADSPEVYEFTAGSS